MAETKRDILPIWVESLMNTEDYRVTALKYSKSFGNGTKSVQYDSSYHRGGKWRAAMGSGYREEEIKIFNKRIEGLEAMIKKAKELAEKEKQNA